MILHSSLDLASYIAALPSDVKHDVFSSPWTSQALFRALAPLAQQYILRLLYVDTPVGRDDLNQWVLAGPEFQQKHNDALRRLEMLSVLTSERQGTAVLLHPTFRSCLRDALSGRCAAVDSAAGQQVQQQLPSSQQITQEAARHWQDVLLYILDDGFRIQKPLGVSTSQLMSIQGMLADAGLVQRNNRMGHELTAEGRRYLLKSTNEQVWILLQEYIRKQAAGEELASTLSFLMQLSFRRVWQPYPLAQLTDKEQQIAAHMAQLGLVLTFVQGSATYFCVTPLAATLCGGSSSSTTATAVDEAGRAATDESAFIIVETNFRVYAHTSSEVQRMVLNMMLRQDCLLPNLYVGTLTRDKFLEALDLGLAAAEVTTFLQQHAHPQAARRVPSVPENVQEQLMLWESETRRVMSDAAYLYSNFEDPELYMASISNAQSLGILLWADNQQQLLAIRQGGHEAMKGFIKECKAHRERQRM